jgi:hypothetical protein
MTGRGGVTLLATGTSWPILVSCFLINAPNGGSDIYLWYLRIPI